MKASELIERLQDIIEESEGDDVEVCLEDVGGARYGSEIGLKVGDEVVLKKYFGVEMPLW